MVAKFEGPPDNLLVDDVGLLRSARQDELPIVVPKELRRDVLSFPHGSRLTEHYRLQRTIAKLKSRFW